MTTSRSCLVILAVLQGLIILFGYFVLYRGSFNRSICHCHCLRSLRGSICKTYELPADGEVLVSNHSSHSPIGTLNSSHSLKFHQMILQETTEVKKNIMRLQLSDADAGISVAILKILDLIEVMHPQQAEKLRTGLREPAQKIVANSQDPIDKTVTILLNAMSPPTHNNLERILTGIQLVYPGMPVLVAIKEPHTINQTLHPTVNTITGTDGGNNWQKLVYKATTPYVLVGRDLVHFDEDVDLERLLPMLTVYDVVGGSVRDAEGKWSLGCQQLNYINYTLMYKNSHFRSQSTCLLCHRLLSPFLARTELIKKVRLADYVSEEMLLEDFFIRLKRQHKSVANCPEVMFHTAAKAHNRDSWLSLVKERKLNRLHLADGRAFRYSCPEAGIRCSVTATIVHAPCCLESLQYSIRDLFRECERRDMPIMLNCGQVVGAVKMAAVLPWELDGDLLYLTKDYQKMLDLRPVMSSLGYRLIQGTPKPRCCWQDTKNLTDGYFALHSGIWGNDVYGRGGLPTEQLLALGLTPTMTLVDGEWLHSPPNPTFFIRNLYAHEIFRHHEHSFQTGLGGGFVAYRPSRLNKCRVLEHQACLDQFHVDGNIQFKQELL